MVSLQEREQLGKQIYQICGQDSALVIGSLISGTVDPAKAAADFKALRDSLVEF